jgi:hypothetical protein
MVFDGLANMGYKFVGAFVFEQPSLCIKQLWVILSVWAISNHFYELQPLTFFFDNNAPYILKNVNFFFTQNVNSCIYNYMYVI